MNQFGQIPFVEKLILLHIFFITGILIQFFDIYIVVAVLVGQVAKLDNFNFTFWMELEIMSELFKCFLLISWFAHVARKKEEFNEQYELIVP